MSLSNLEDIVVDEAAWFDDVKLARLAELLGPIRSNAGEVRASSSLGRVDGTRLQKSLPAKALRLRRMR